MGKESGPPVRAPASVKARLFPPALKRLPTFQGKGCPALRSRQMQRHVGELDTLYGKALQRRQGEGKASKSPLDPSPFRQRFRW